MIIIENLEEQWPPNVPKNYTGTFWFTEDPALIEYYVDGELMFAGDIHNDISNIKTNYPDLYVEVMARLLSSKCE